MIIQQYKITVGGHKRYFQTLQEAEKVSERYYKKNGSIVGIEYANTRGQKHEHRYFLKCDSFSKQKYHRECECGDKKKITKYRISN